MISPKELGLFEKKKRDEDHRLKRGGKILSEMIQRVQDSTNFTEDNLDNWPDYSAWDNWDRG